MRLRCICPAPTKLHDHRRAAGLGANASRHAGQRVVIAGNGPLNLQVAAVVEAAARPAVLTHGLVIAGTAPALAPDGARLLARRRAGDAAGHGDGFSHRAALFVRR